MHTRVNGRLLLAMALIGTLWMVPTARAADVPADVARGEHVATAITHCTSCHGADYGGGRSFPAGSSGERVMASNLTAGAGGVGSTYSDADYIRAIREGVRPDGSRLAIMPSADYSVLTDRDVASLVAYIRSLPPVDRSVPRVVLSSTLSHEHAPPPLPAAQTPGAYLARLGGCLSCHGSGLHGETLRGVVAPDISHGGIGTWSFADFSTAMRSGKTPDGRMLVAPMPWPAIGRLTDVELRQLYDYLQATPAKSPS
jgi:cytochrome c553